MNDEANIVTSVFNICRLGDAVPVVSGPGVDRSIEPGPRRAAPPQRHSPHSEIVSLLVCVVLRAAKIKSAIRLLRQAFVTSLS